jgi:hypothetical protein
MSQKQQSLRTRIEEQTDKELENLEFEECDTYTLARKERKDGASFESAILDVTESSFDLEYKSGEPFERTFIQRASKYEDGVDVVMSSISTLTEQNSKELAEIIAGALNKY